MNKKEKEETLLEKATKHQYRKTRNYYSDEEIELAIAYLEGKITSRQGSEVIGKNKKSPGSFTHFCTSALRFGVQAGKIRVYIEGGKALKFHTKNHAK